MTRKFFSKHEICALLGYNAASSGNPLPTFRDNVSVPSSRVKKSYSSWTSRPLKMGPIHCPETSVKDYYHSTLRYTLAERRTPQHRGGSLKSLFFQTSLITCLHNGVELCFVWRRDRSSKYGLFDPGPAHMRCVENKVTLGQDMFRVLLFWPVSMIPPMLHIHPI
jgi:hypothetical protein